VDLEAARTLSGAEGLPILRGQWRRATMRLAPPPLIASFIRFGRCVFIRSAAMLASFPQFTTRLTDCREEVGYWQHGRPTVSIGLENRKGSYIATEFGQLVEAIGDLPRHWWVVALRGVAAIIFGILAFVWPGITLAVLILFFGAYAVVDGILALYSATRSHGEHVWALLVEGILGIAAGLVALFWPGITALALLIVIATWAILTGALEVYAAIRLRKVIKNEWALVFAGVLSVLFGVLLLAQPGAGALALVWLIGAYAIIFGIGMLMFAWRLRGMLHDMPQMPRAQRTTPV
jgi:uncharacterized membrane protein HdeD (DUF308 family)